MSQLNVHNHDTISPRGPVNARKRRSNFGSGFFNAHSLKAWEKRSREAEAKRKEQERLDEIKRKKDDPRENANKYERSQWNQFAGIDTSKPNVSAEDARWLLRNKQEKEREANVPRNPLEIAINKGPGKNPKSLAERVATLIALGNASIGVGKGSWGVGNKALGKNLRTTGTTRSGKPFQKLSPSKTRSGKKYGATNIRRDPPPVEMEMEEVPGPSSAEQPTEKTPLFTQKGKKQGYDMEMDSVPNIADEAGHGSEETPFNGGPSNAAPEGAPGMEPPETARGNQSAEEFWANDGKWGDDTTFNEGNPEFESFEEWQRKLNNAERSRARSDKIITGSSIEGVTTGTGIGLGVGLGVKPKSKPRLRSRRPDSESPKKPETKTEKESDIEDQVGGSAAAWLGQRKRRRFHRN